MRLESEGGQRGAKEVREEQRRSESEGVREVGE